MKMVYLFIFCIFMVCSCKEKQSTLYYSLYGNDNLLIEKNKFKQTLFKLKDNEYLVRIIGKNYDESFKFKTDSTGLYRYCDNHYILTHHFDSVENQVFCKSSPPFIYQKTYWTLKKTYFIGNKPYEIIFFSELSGSEISSSSYYLKGFGFICYYNYNSDKYILCDSVSNMDFNLDVLHRINDSLIHDTTVFERYIVKYPKVKFLPPNNK
jgi:hypothetical protein